MKPTTTHHEVTNRRQIRAWLLGAAVLILVRLVGELVPLTNEVGWLWITRLGEAWIVLGLMWWVVTDLPLREIRAQIGWPRAAAVLGLVGLVVVGHSIEVGVSTYPFVDWNMYTARADEAVYGVVAMNMADGRTQPLPLRDGAQISKEPRTVTDRLLELAERAAEDDEAARLLEESLAVLVRLAESPLPESVSVLRCAVHKPADSPEASCETLGTFPVDSS